MREFEIFHDGLRGIRNSQGMREAERPKRMATQGTQKDNCAFTCIKQLTDESSCSRIKKIQQITQLGVTVMSFGAFIREKRQEKAFR